MESVAALYDLSERAYLHSRNTERVAQMLGNLSRLANAAWEATDAVKRMAPGAESSRTRRAECELAAAKLELAVKQARAEWRGFTTGVEELLVSLEAAPLLEACP